MIRPTTLASWERWLFISFMWMFWLQSSRDQAVALQDVVRYAVGANLVSQITASNFESFKIENCMKLLWPASAVFSFFVSLGLELLVKVFVWKNDMSFFSVNDVIVAREINNKGIVTVGDSKVSQQLAGELRNDSPIILFSLLIEALHSCILQHQHSNLLISLVNFKEIEQMLITQQFEQVQFIAELLCPLTTFSGHVIFSNKSSICLNKWRNNCSTWPFFLST